MSYLLEGHKRKRVSSGFFSSSSSSPSSACEDTAGLDMDGVYFNADALSLTIESYGSSEHLDLEAEQWRDVLSFFFGSLSISAEQLSMNIFSCSAETERLPPQLPLQEQLVLLPAALTF
jgi:hypothetical protein